MYKNKVEYHSKLALGNRIVVNSWITPNRISKYLHFPNGNSLIKIVGQFLITVIG